MIADLFSALLGLAKAIGYFFGFYSKEIKEISNISFKITRDQIFVTNDSPNALTDIVFVDKIEKEFYPLSIMQNNSPQAFLIQARFLSPSVIFKHKYLSKNEKLIIYIADNIVDSYMIFAYGNNKYIKDSKTGKTKKLLNFKGLEKKWHIKSSGNLKYEEVIRKPFQKWGHI
jgi:hypothetical protein